MKLLGIVLGIVLGVIFAAWVWAFGAVAFAVPE